MRGGGPGRFATLAPPHARAAAILGRFLVAAASRDTTAEMSDVAEGGGMSRLLHRLRPRRLSCA